MDVADARVELLARTPYEARYTPDAAIIGFAYERQTGIHAFAGDRRSGFRSRPNGLAYVPAGCDVYSQSDEGGEYLRIALTFDEDETWADGTRFSDVIDPRAIDAALHLRRLLLAERAPDALEVESQIRTLRCCVTAVLRGDTVEPREGAWMTGHRLRRIDDLIEARLDRTLTVRDLAAALGLSTGFFSRAFRAAVGRPPHDHIIERRLSRARRLLQDPDLDLGDVALACGFASHAHMSATFRRRLGVAPSRLRLDPTATSGAAQSPVTR